MQPDHHKHCRWERNVARPSQSNIAGEKEMYPDHHRVTLQVRKKCTQTITDNRCRWERNVPRPSQSNIAGEKEMYPDHHRVTLQVRKKCTQTITDKHCRWGRNVTRPSQTNIAGEKGIYPASLTIIAGEEMQKSLVHCSLFSVKTRTASTSKVHRAYGCLRLIRPHYYY